MNSVLQLLLNNAKLANILLYSNSSLINPESEFKGILTKELISLFKQKYFHNTRIIDPKAFKEALSQVNLKFKGNLHKDPSECLSTILEVLAKDTENQGNSDQILLQKGEIVYKSNKKHQLKFKNTSTNFDLPLIYRSNQKKEEIIVKLIKNRELESLILLVKEENNSLILIVQDFKETRPLKTLKELETELKRHGKIRGDSEINVLVDDRKILGETGIKEFLNPKAEVKIVEILPARQGYLNLKVVVMPETQENLSLKEIEDLKENSQFCIEAKESEFTQERINCLVKHKIAEILGIYSEPEIKIPVERFWSTYIGFEGKVFSRGNRLTPIRPGKTEFSSDIVLVAEIKDYVRHEEVQGDESNCRGEAGFPCNYCGNRIAALQSKCGSFPSSEYNFIHLGKFQEKQQFCLN